MNIYLIMHYHMNSLLHVLRAEQVVSTWGQKPSVLSAEQAM